MMPELEEVFLVKGPVDSMEFAWLGQFEQKYQAIITQLKGTPKEQDFKNAIDLIDDLILELVNARTRCHALYIVEKIKGNKTKMDELSQILTEKFSISAVQDKIRSEETILENPLGRSFLKKHPQLPPDMVKRVSEHIMKNFSNLGPRGMCKMMNDTFVLLYRTFKTSKISVYKAKMHKLYMIPGLADRCACGVPLKINAAGNSINATAIGKCVTCKHCINLTHVCDSCKFGTFSRQDEPCKSCRYHKAWAPVVSTQV